jgi:hypothetical protein
MLSSLLGVHVKVQCTEKMTEGHLGGKGIVRQCILSTEHDLHDIYCSMGCVCQRWIIFWGMKMSFKLKTNTSHSKRTEGCSRGVGVPQTVTCFWMQNSLWPLLMDSISNERASLPSLGITNVFLWKWLWWDMGEWSTDVSESSWYSEEEMFSSQTQSKNIRPDLAERRAFLTWRTWQEERHNSTSPT